MCKMEDEKKLRKSDSAYSVKPYYMKISGNQLPSNGQVLKIPIFINLDCLSYTVRKSACKVLKDVFPFWEKA